MRRPFKKKRHIIIYDDSVDGFDEFYPNQLQRSSDKTGRIKCLEGEMCKPLKPGSVEGYFTPCYFLVVWVLSLRLTFLHVYFRRKEI